MTSPEVKVNAASALHAWIRSGQISNNKTNSNNRLTTRTAECVIAARTKPLNRQWHGQLEADKEINKRGGTWRVRDGGRDRTLARGCFHKGRVSSCAPPSSPTPLLFPHYSRWDRVWQVSEGEGKQIDVFGCVQAEAIERWMGAMM